MTNQILLSEIHILYLNVNQINPFRSDERSYRINFLNYFTQLKSLLLPNINLIIIRKKHINLNQGYSNVKNLKLNVNK